MVIDTYYSRDCFKEIPLNYYITIEGDSVIFPGTNSGTALGLSWSRIRTFFAFGPVIMLCKVSYCGGNVLETQSRSGNMIGPFVFVN